MGKDATGGGIELTKLSIEVNDKTEEVKVIMPPDIKEALPMLMSLTNTMARYFDITNNEILGVMAEYLLEEEEDV